MMRCLIADDEPLLARHLAARLNVLAPQMQLIGLCHDGASALAQLQQHKPDVAWLDIRMPALSGLEVAAVCPRECRIVFVTAYDEFAVRAFEHAAVDYLLKPVSDARLQTTLQRLHTPAPPQALETALTHLLPTAPFGAAFWVGDQRLTRVLVSEVSAVVADDKYSILYTIDGHEHLLRQSLKMLRPNLELHHFWQIHRSTFIHPQHLVAINRDLWGKSSVEMRGVERSLAVSRSYTGLFRGLL